MTYTVRVIILMGGIGSSEKLSYCCGAVESERVQMLISEVRGARELKDDERLQEELLFASGSVTENVDLELVTMPLPEQLGEEIEEPIIDEPYSL